MPTKDDIKEIIDIQRRAGLNEETYGDVWDNWISNYIDNVKRSFQEPGPEIEKQYPKPSSDNKYVNAVIEATDKIFNQYESEIKSLLSSSAYKRTPREKRENIKQQFDNKIISLLYKSARALYSMQFVVDEEEEDEDKYPFIADDIWDNIENWIEGKLSMLGLPPAWNELSLRAMDDLGI